MKILGIDYFMHTFCSYLIDVDFDSTNASQSDWVMMNIDSQLESDVVLYFRLSEYVIQQDISWV